MNISDTLPEFSVSEISSFIKLTLEDGFSKIRVRGEISGCKKAPSGHIYLNLKDENALLAAVCWRGNAANYAFKLEDGLEVVATGNITAYAGTSKYQLVISHIEAKGDGALMALFEQRKRKLAAEGLFDGEHKKALPSYPKIIGVVTSPTGAVIRDILHRIGERMPLRVLVWPSAVQGARAAAEISAAIQGFNNLGADPKLPKPDIIIIARGGGSIEDLWAFNEEEVVRAVFASKIPIVSAIGHETDFTLTDFAADLRAPTPSAAAEIVTKVRSELIFYIDSLFQRAGNSVSNLIRSKLTNLKHLGMALISPQNLIENKAQRLDNAVFRLDAAIIAKMQKYHDRLKNYARLLNSYNYQNVLQRGYVLLHDKEGNLLSSASAVKSGQEVKLEFIDGKKDAIVK